MEKCLFPFSGVSVESDANLVTYDHERDPVQAFRDRGERDGVFSCKETRLLHSDMRITEIAHELNFTDESHLNRTFKKIKGMSPSAYRRQYAINC
ncbi:helix-turn-helix domain-containing protein [Chitinophaga pinensis]|uniref:helix-turn-helix domain-containing protein n=1 Tax=Chitinophaga pinensis TaxID=79329 RepID=UPI0021BDD16D|nr:helix-turn-helix domain-containing protein [Chitinophaga pinensis]